MLLMQTLQQICVVMQNETGKDTNVKLQKNYVIVLWADFDCIWAKFCMKNFCVYYFVG
jgi:hypothetical protein